MRHATMKEVGIGLVLLLIMSVIAGFVIVRDYRERPGIMETESLKADDRGLDYIALSWGQERNVKTYVIWYKQFGSNYSEWTKLDLDAAAAGRYKNKGHGGKRAGVRIEGLSEGTKYVFTIRPDSEEREGIRTEGKVFATRSHQNVTIEKEQYTKLTSSRTFSIGAEAKTMLKYSSDNEKVAVVNSSGRVKIKGAGTADISIKAVETRDYTAAEAEVRINVIKSDPVNASGAKAFVIGSLNDSNCSAVKTVVGVGGIHVPQSFAYTGDKYVIAYDGSGSQRIVTYDVEGDGREVARPGVSLGHPNGFTYCNETKEYLSVQGWSGRMAVYSTKKEKWGTATLPYGCSGIGYDRERKLLFTSSRTAMVAYTLKKDGWNVKYRTGVVRHRGKVYTQDCGGYGGIMLHCMSGSSKHGTNYIDMYDMIHGKYMGSFACELSEVESVIVDNDGYMQILANNTSGHDYIWRTGINIADIAAGI